LIRQPAGSHRPAREGVGDAADGVPGPVLGGLPRPAAGRAAVGAGGLLFFGPLLLILFRQKYPRWWFDWNLELQRFGNRVGAYLVLVTDRYPPFRLAN
jgi:hypothetical protein